MTPHHTHRVGLTGLRSIPRVHTHAGASLSQTPPGGRNIYCLYRRRMRNISPRFVIRNEYHTRDNCRRCI